jgi:hypothetical protein
MARCWPGDAMLKLDPWRFAGLEAIGVKDEWWPLPRRQAFVRLLPLRSKRLQPRTLRAGTAGGSVGATAWSGAGAPVTLRTSRTQKGRTTRRAECSASGWSLRSGRLRISMPDVEKVGILPGL